MAGGEQNIPMRKQPEVAEPTISREVIFKNMVIARANDIIYEMGGGVGEREKRQAFIQALGEIKEKFKNGF